MRKIFVSALLIVLAFTLSAIAEVEPNAEIHRVIGGLYSLVCAVNLNGNTNPHINQLRQFFTGIPDDWHNEAQLTRSGGEIWAGVSVGKYSTARHYLRDNSAELGIAEEPEGYSWLGGGYAWLKASVIKDIKAARGTGKDSGTIFLSTDGVNWWQAFPDFTREAAAEIMKRWGARRVPELHKPSGEKSESLYESVKPSDVQKPKNMHVGRRKSSFDMEIGLGRDVFIDPVPNRRRR
ncbi:MAG: hypothetical protein IJR85_01640 [Synergistaceae bacterium]|nr:hypothetical protein [Synergistaceae bacterium]